MTENLDLATPRRPNLSSRDVYVCFLFDNSSDRSARPLATDAFRFERAPTDLRGVFESCAILNCDGIHLASDDVIVTRHSCQVSPQLRT